MLGDDYEILSMKDIGVDIDIVEDGKTFEENAVIKAESSCGRDRRDGSCGRFRF